MVFIVSFAFSLGPVVWTVINEIFPSRVRGRAVSIATAANWGAAFLVTQFFLSIVDAIGEAETFFMFAGICIVSFIWVARWYPRPRAAPWRRSRRCSTPIWPRRTRPRAAHRVRKLRLT